MRWLVTRRFAVIAAAGVLILAAAAVFWPDRTRAEQIRDAIDWGAGCDGVVEINTPSRWADEPGTLEALADETSQIGGLGGLGCYVVDYLRFDTHQALVKALDHHLPHMSPICLTETEIVESGVDDESKFWHLCDELKGRIAEPKARIVGSAECPGGLMLPRPRGMTTTEVCRRDAGRSP
jgi:hypothetical protein